ncbi:dTDP-4-dehydrorhamnose reductase [Achromobacter deleyi]|uniref:dTDP-4-dehydrorhamnose reductase n=1 Tax=Achromobacter deleyi TaxID=1353891 RepID=A0A6S6ZFZ1_9BURK|nr:dTDP-4-dehydrorhamnose reductase [Achromobacter deleyi]CAB3678358.1 dTDP-4-dehydrorhamnose reductase [Achromobacter deleyi]CAB3827612.1 dTDP-4-dehydrorhamnose reductase [Achromobacter deleyi]CAB3834213.1 dTDP-4-dehydrorhamnose reductase [Achromobacter deleyi]CAB3865295.1 dTDP-4-dehydrorhamnose reductase [Achromobacter deleyi]
MKILLLGKDGQVGQELQRTLLPLGETLALGRSGADLSDLSTLRATLQAHNPDIIVNAAAYTAVDKAESEPQAAAQINTIAVSALAQHAKATDALLVHYSTDYVFNGAGDTPYLETNPTDPQSVYGTTKRDGEAAILDSGCNALIFRTSWVFSSRGGNFLKTILRLAATKDSLNVVADQFGAPTSAELIADVTALAINAFRQDRLQAGIYHLTASGVVSWCEFARYIVNQATAQGIALTLTANQVHAIPAADYPTPAKRPQNSRLDNSKLSSALRLQMPHWTAHASRAIDQLKRLGNPNNA